MNGKLILVLAAGVAIWYVTRKKPPALVTSQFSPINPDWNDPRTAPRPPALINPAWLQPLPAAPGSTPAGHIVVVPTSRPALL